MALRHIAVFLILGAAFVAWTLYARRQEAAKQADLSERSESDG